jgi:hypothetical protein
VICILVKRPLNFPCVSGPQNKKAQVNMTSVQKQIRFGIIALEKGFITSRQLGKAVNAQLNEDLEKGKHRLIGEILVDMGFMTVSQVEELLDERKKGMAVSEPF